jgi:hypothetical protein
MSSLLIANLSQNDNSLALNRNEMKDIVGGDTCVPVEIRFNEDGTYDLIFRCTPS